LLVDSELVSYQSFSGNTFSGVARGQNATAATVHSSGAPVDQTQCIIQSQGGVPNLTSTLGKRTLQTTLIIIPNMIKPPSALLSKAGISVSSTGQMTGNASVDPRPGTIQNLGATSSAVGSNIRSVGGGSLSGAAQTLTANGVTSWSTPAPAHTGNDIVWNDSTLSSLSSDQFFNLFFSMTKAQVQSSADQVCSLNNSPFCNFTPTTSQIIWVTQGASLSNITIGSPTAPVILILNNGGNISGTTTIYGFVYYAGGGMSMGDTSRIIGALATEGGGSCSWTSQPNGSTSQVGGIIYNPNILNLLGLAKPTFFPGFGLSTVNFTK